MALPSTINDALLNRLTGMVASSGGATHKVLEVYTGEVITALPQSTPEDVERAYADARERPGDLGGLAAGQAAAVMRKFHALLLKDYEPIVDLMQAETGKARRMSFEEVCDVAMTTSHYLKTAAGCSASGGAAGSSRWSRRAPRSACPRASSG